LIASLTTLFVPWRQTRLRWLAIYLGGAALTLLFFMRPYALGLWEAVPALAVIQFPWRLLALVALLLCPLAGLTLYEIVALEAMWRPAALEDQAPGLLVIATLAIVASMTYVNGQLDPVEPWREDGRAVYAFEQEHPDMIAYTEWVRERPFTATPLSADYAADDYEEEFGYTTSLHRLAIVRGVGTVVSSYSRGSSFGGVVRVDRSATVRLYLYYFPGWQVLVDGAPGLYHISEQQGLIDVDVPAGEHRIDVHMTTTPVRQLGMAISAVTLLPVLMLLFWPRRRKVQTAAP
ncbi:MAG: hypothetical protein KDE31_37790, partial [Caldilineaceae bacterium]|nr:hypothetical protein [Caldilineaceae bacterium]